MHRVWLWIHPIQFLTALYIFIGVLAFSIHFILLSTERYNWLGPRGPAAKKAEIIVPMPTRTTEVRVQAHG
jgi:light-harvesting complex 1 alpha chain